MDPLGGKRACRWELQRCCLRGSMQRRNGKRGEGRNGNREFRESDECGGTRRRRAQHTGDGRIHIDETDAPQADERKPIANGSRPETRETKSVALSGR